MSKAQSMEYSPLAPFAGAGVGGDRLPPRVFGSPMRYVQGDGVIDHAGRFLARLGISRPAVLLSARSQQAEGGRLLASLAAADMAAQIATFNGECSLEEIGLHVSALATLQQQVDALVAVGGGKVMDAGRAIAHRLGLPVVVAPSLASNDAPCAAVSVIYTPEGVTADAELYDHSPMMVLVDTGVVAVAGERYLVAGMGDAMATWYEARVCAQGSHAITAFGGRPTLAGTALAELCAKTIYDCGQDAVLAVRASRVNEALERVVEANTLLSGLGYESGGLAVAHAVAQGCTVIERLHRDFLHGEMVALGTLTQLALESRTEDAEQVARFFTAVGLPVHLGQLALSPDDQADLAAVVEAALSFPFIGNMPVEVSAESLHAAVLQAHTLGCRITASDGDEAYRKLHAR